MSLLEGLTVISPTKSQSTSLVMSDYIHPKCASLAPYDENYNDYTNIILDSGTRGSGKSDKAIFEMWQEINKGFGNEWTGVVFRRTYNDLNDFIDKTDRFFGKLGYKYTISRGNGARIKFSTGEQILFRIMVTTEDYNKYHGHGYQFILFEEGTLWFDIMDLVYQMMSCLRSPYNNIYKNEIAAGTKTKMVLKMRINTNPFGVGVMALKKVFIDNRNSGEAFIIDGITYIHFLSTFTDNPFIDNSYINSFKKITNKAKRDAWLWADWNGKSSGAFGDLWNPDIFCLPQFKIPTRWEVTRTMDFGTADPFSILYWAETDGTGITYTNIKGEEIFFCPPEGTLILLYEWYGCDTSVSQNTGLYMSGTAIAKGIKVIDKKILKDMCEPNHSISDGEADDNICGKNGQVNTVEDLFKAEGIYWRKPDKSAGSRERGVALMIEIMSNTIENATRRHLYVFSINCPNWIDNVMTLCYNPKKPDDVLTLNVPDHDWDCTKYKLSSKKQKQSFSNSF